jgi:hypothetical protein
LILDFGLQAMVRGDRDDSDAGEEGFQHSGPNQEVEPPQFNNSKSKLVSPWRAWLWAAWMALTIGFWIANLMR